MEDKQMIYGSQFEDDYLIRSLGGIVSQPETALTELVANAWGMELYKQAQQRLIFR